MKAADTIAREYFGGTREEIGGSVFDEFVELIETDRDQFRKSLRVDQLHEALHGLVKACKSHRVRLNSDESALEDAETLLHLLAQEGRDE